MQCMSLLTSLQYFQHHKVLQKLPNDDDITEFRICFGAWVFVYDKEYTEEKKP